MKENIFNYFKKVYLGYLQPFFEKHKRKNLFWLSVFFLASLVLVAPLFGKNICAGIFTDFFIHARFVKSAHTALFKEFAFPLFYINDLEMALQPIFRYYSVTIYVVSSLFMLFGLSAYNSLLLGSAFLYSLGAWGIFLTARFLRCDRFSSFLGGLTYLYAPYFLVDIYARYAFTEVSAIGILPLVFYSVVRLCAGNGRKWGIRSALLTALLLISHKIFFPWILLFSILFLITHFNFHQIKKTFRRLLSLMFWMGTGMLVSSPYWLTAYLNLPNLKIVSVIKVYYQYLSDWRLLLCPFFYVHPDCLTPNLATQYGLPVILGFILLAFSGWKSRLRLKLSMLAIGLLIFLLETDAFGLFMRFPNIFLTIQFPYRLLIFTALFGSLSAAIAFFSLAKWHHVRRLKWGFFLVIMIYLILYYKLPAETGLTSEILENDKLSYFDVYFEKESFEGRQYSGIYADGWIEQDAVIKFKREFNDEVSFSLNGIIATQIAKSKPFSVTILIDGKPGSHEKIEGPEVKIEKALPSVPNSVSQEIKFHFSDYFIPKETIPNSPDVRKLVLRNHIIKVWKKRDVKVDRSQMFVRGNKVRLQRFEMRKDRDYILPVMYSRHLSVEPDFISLLPHPDGIVLTSARNGSFDITVVRKEFPYVNKKILEAVKAFGFL